MKIINFLFFFYLVNFLSVESISQIISTEIFEDSTEYKYVIKTIDVDSVIEIKGFENKKIIYHSIEENNFIHQRTFYLNGKMESERFELRYETAEEFGYIPVNYCIHFYEDGDTLKYEKYDSVPNIEMFNNLGWVVPNLTIKIDTFSLGHRSSRTQMRNFDHADYAEEFYGWQYVYYSNGQLARCNYYDVPLDKNINKLRLAESRGPTIVTINETYFENGVLEQRFEITAETVSNFRYYESGKKMSVCITTIKYYIEHGQDTASCIEYNEDGSILR